ncbi:MAG: hypothetical protein HC769_36335 [Cyanobacteria bacterium CRU_2_1]|nr:hypothetical protein [Cyanobacteria bacterium CRU_2_1]
MSEVEGAIDGGIQLTTRLERTGRGDRRGSIGSGSRSTGPLCGSSLLERT